MIPCMLSLCMASYLVSPGSSHFGVEACKMDRGTATNGRHLVVVGFADRFRFSDDNLDSSVSLDDRNQLFWQGFLFSTS